MSEKPYECLNNVYQNGKTFWKESGKHPVESDFFIDNKFSIDRNTISIYYDKGTLLEKCFYRNDYNGEGCPGYDNNILFETFYLNGNKKFDINMNEFFNWRSFYSNGQIKEGGNFNNISDIVGGNFRNIIDFFGDGTPCPNPNYWKSYYRNGQLRIHLIFKKGLSHKGYYYDKEGELVSDNIVGEGKYLCKNDRFFFNFREESSFYKLLTNYNFRFQRVFNTWNQDSYDLHKLIFTPEDYQREVISEESLWNEDFQN